jgi:serpin B
VGIHLRDIVKSQTITSCDNGIGVTLPLADNSMYTAVQLPYNDDQFYAIAMLPKGGSLIECMSQLEAPDIIPFRDTLLDLRLPSFKVEKMVNLNSILQNLGIKSIFGFLDDFAPMFANLVTPCCISEIIQKVVVDVNEEGTVAAAVTAVITITFGAPMTPKPFILTFDKPFLFSIHHKTSGSILFLGSVEQP